MRKEFEMTEEHAKMMVEACRTGSPLISVTGSAYETPAERVNRAWQRLGQELGFDWKTVQPVEGKHKRFFTAEVPDVSEGSSGTDREARGEEEGSPSR